MTTTTQTYHGGNSPKIPEAPDLNTIPDPRAPSPRPTGNRSPSAAGPQHPDLSNEVAALSAKLINAINNQTNLDDALQETRHELDEARAYISRLEQENQQHRDALASGALVRRVDIEQKEERLERRMVEEQRKRSSAERQKKGMESELENLTGQLFEEANAMVAAARHEKQEADRRADMFKTKLADTEVLLQSQQTQLSQLKEVLHDERKRPRDSMHSNNTAPTTPVIGSNDKLSSATFNFPQHTRNAHSTQSLPPPASPLHFDHLIHPVVRTDVQSYEDFTSLLRTTKGSTPPTRSASGSYVGLNVLGLGSKDMSSQSTVIPSIRSATKSFTRSSSAQSTTTPGSFPSPKPDESDEPMVALKDTKYYKRALAEDIEPTLRLDTAPGLSWLARRTVLSSITTGRLIVEPYPTRHAFHSPAYACSLCGEVRTSEEHLRRYRFRASDSDEAQRYPVCDYCLARLRSTCDFTSFLRMARKGAMKNETIDDCRLAWEECIKLREKMFWSRVGGGVIPALGSSPVSPIHDPYPEASRSDSDLASISRADSQRTTSSEQQPEVTPLSEAGTSDRLPSKETYLAPRQSIDSVRGQREGLSMLKQSTEGARDMRTNQETSMPPPELRPTQSGARDADPVKRDSMSLSRPTSSAASNKAFFEAKSTPVREEPAVSPVQASPVQATSSNPFKRPSSSAASNKAFFESKSTQARNDLATASNEAIPATFPRPSSSKSAKSFSFGPRDGRLPPAAAGDATLDESEGAATLDRFAPRTIASSTPARSSTPAADPAAKMSAVNYLSTMFAPKPAESSSIPQSALDERSNTQEARRGSVPNVTTGVTEHSITKLAMGAEFAGPGLPSTSTSSKSTPLLASPSRRPVSTTAATPPTIQSSPRGRPASMLPPSTNTTISPPAEPAFPHHRPAATTEVPRKPVTSSSSSSSSPRARPLSTAAATLPASSSTSPPKPRPTSMFPTSNPISPPSEPYRPTAIPPLKPASLAPSPRLAPTTTPAQSAPSAPSTPSRVAALASKFTDDATSPERSALPSTTLPAATSTRNHSVPRKSLPGSPERSPRRSRRGSTVDGREGSREVSPVKIPGAFA